MRSFIAALMILVSSSAFAQSEWINYESTSDGNKYYIRAGSLHTAGQYKRMWTLEDFAKPDKDGGRSAIALEEFNCNTRQFRLLQINLYKSQMGRGVVIDGGSIPSKWAYVVPGSVAEAALEIACSN